MDRVGSGNSGHVFVSSSRLSAGQSDSKSRCLWLINSFDLGHNGWKYIALHLVICQELSKPPEMEPTSIGTLGCDFCAWGRKHQGNCSSSEAMSSGEAVARLCWNRCVACSAHENELVTKQHTISVKFAVLSGWHRRITVIDVTLLHSTWTQKHGRLTRPYAPWLCNSSDNEDRVWDEDYDITNGLDCLCTAATVPVQYTACTYNVYSLYFATNLVIGWIVWVWVLALTATQFQMKSMIHTVNNFLSKLGSIPLKQLDWFCTYFFQIRHTFIIAVL